MQSKITHIAQRTNVILLQHDFKQAMTTAYSILQIIAILTLSSTCMLIYIKNIKILTKIYIHTHNQNITCTFKS